jgi:hypothetical protein
MTSPSAPSAPAEARPFDFAVRIAANGVPFAVLLGTAVVAGTVLAVTLLRPATASPDSSVTTLLLAGTVGGILAAGVAAWIALRPLQSMYRRGGLAAVSAFATALVMLVCVPVHALLGAVGLAALIALCAAGCVWFGRRLRRLAAAA